MIVITEGIDRVGKTTFCKMLEQAGFMYFKDDWVLRDSFVGPDKSAKNFLLGKLDTTISMLRQLHAKGKNVVVDRLHLTEWVYGKHTRKYEPNAEHLTKIDRALDALDAILVYVMPTCISKSSSEHGSSLNNHEAEFYKRASESAIKRKIFVKYDGLEDVANDILDATCIRDLYLASPFFTPEQTEREEFVKRSLRTQGLTVFSPKENCFLSPTASNTAQQSVFKQNCDAINSCKAVFAITDGKDIGTIWEAGYAYAIGKPVIYFAETLGERGFNLMLAQSGRLVILNREEIHAEEIMQSITRSKGKFKGLIE